MNSYWAHSGGHCLEDHLRQVGMMAREFARPIPSSESWAYLAGLWHDLGRYQSGLNVQVIDSPDFLQRANVESQSNKLGEKVIW